MPTFETSEASGRLKPYKDDGNITAQNSSFHAAPSPTPSSQFPLENSEQSTAKNSPDTGNQSTN